MFVLQSDKAETDLNTNFGLFSIDGCKMLYYGSGHYFDFYWRADHIEVVSINF